MTAGMRSIIIALISALATVVAAIIVAGEKTERTINEAGGELKSLRDDIGKLRDDVERAKTIITATTQSLPQAISKANQGSLKTFSDEFHGASPSTRELLDITGKGALISGAVLGFYFKDAPGGANYVVQVEIDGIAFKYPSVSQRAYAQTGGGNNAGVLVLPPVRYSKSLRITYWYPGGGRYVSAYAVVLPD